MKVDQNTMSNIKN